MNLDRINRIFYKKVIMNEKERLLRAGFVDSLGFVFKTYRSLTQISYQLLGYNARYFSY